MFNSVSIGKRSLAVLGCFLALGGSLAANDHSQPKYALVKVPVASVFKTPQPYGERVTQVMFAEPVLPLFDSGCWTKVLVVNQYRTDRGYPGWILKEHLSTDLSFAGYYEDNDTGLIEANGPKSRHKEAPLSLLTIIKPKVSLHTLPEDKSPVSLTLYGSTQVRALSYANGWYEIKMPGKSKSLYMRGEGAVEGYLPDEASCLLQTAFRFMAVPYVWGGMSSLGIDCSGFTYVCCKIHGLILPRDADQQSQVGREVSYDDLLPGDLLFFGRGLDHITHVGFYLGNGTYLDASGKKGVAISKLSPKPSKGFGFQCARRVFSTKFE